MAIRPALAASLAAIIGAVVLAGLLLTPPALDDEPAMPEIPVDVGAWLVVEERAVADRYGLVAGTEKRVRWQTAGERTRHAVVYLHGFSASRAEAAPLPARVADVLGANLYETRLKGHGHLAQPMHDTAAEDWLADALEAIAIGRAIGDEVILIGTSTGATLALALGNHPAMDEVRALVLMSPNLAPRDPNARWATRPFGPLIARAVVGETRSFEPHNALQARYWTTRYPTAAAIETMRLVDRVQSRLPMAVTPALLVMVSPQDGVVSPQAARDAFAAIDAPRKSLVEYRNSGDPSRHVLAGNILSPDTTDEVAEIILEFLAATSAP